LKKLMLVFLSVGLLTLTAAKAADEFRIGVVNANEIVEKSPQYDTVRKSLDAEFKRRNEDLLAKQNQVKKLEEKKNRDGSVMSAAELKRLEQDIRSLVRKLKSTSEEYREDFNLRRSEEINKLLRQVSEVVHQVGEEENIDVILSEGAGVVYASKRVDLTDKVLRRLKEQYKSSPKK